MLKSGILELIRSFSQADVNRFHIFLRSPYFNMNSNAVRLFDIVEKSGPGYNDPGLDKEALWKELFPGKKYNYGTMKNLIFDLKKLATKFITIEELGTNKLEESEILVRALGKRNVPGFFISKINEIEKKYEKDNLHDTGIDDFDDYFTSMFRIKWMKHAYLRVHDPKLAKEEDLRVYTALMAGSFLIVTSRFYNNILAQSIDINFHQENNAVVTLAEAFNKTTAAEIIAGIKVYSPAAAKVIDLYRLKMKAMMKDAGEEDFFEFRNEVYKNGKYLTSLDLKEFLQNVVNCANKLESPRINVYKERIDSLKLRMKKKMLTHDDGRVYVLELLQYFWSAGILDDFDVIEKLIKDYISRSQDEKKDNIMKCGEIFFKIRDGKYNEALELISTVTPESFMMKVHLRNLKARCFYMTDDYDSFLYERDSLNHFLKSNKSLSERNISQLKDNFEKINRMFKLKRDFEGSVFKKLKSEIMSNENYAVWMRREVLRIGE